MILFYLCGQRNCTMLFLLPVIFIVALALVAAKLPFFRNTGLSVKILITLFLLKAGMAILLNVLYTTYYDRETSDIYRYFYDGEIIYHALKENPADYFKMVTGIGGNDPALNRYYYSMDNWIKEFDFNLYNENRTIIRFNAIARLISFGNIHVHAVIMAFLSFIGCISLFKAFSRFMPEKKILLLGSVMLIPSVLLWGSGLLKEGIISFALGVMIYCFFEILYGKTRVWYLVIFIVSMMLVWITKFYVLLSVLPGLLSFAVIKLTHSRRSILIFASVHVLFFLIGLLIKYITPYDVFSIISLKQEAFIKMVSFTPDVGSPIKLPFVDPSPFGILKLLPLALFNAFFQPLPVNAHSILMMASSAENIFIIVCLITALIFSKWDHQHLSLVLMGFSFTFILFWICGMTTPVAGALVRYKSPALPFLLISCILIFDEKKMLRFINFVKQNIISLK